MEKLTLELPTLYGDHHVIEVRRILLALPGVLDVYASSAFQVVEVTYDPAQINELQIKMKLDETGYLGEWSIVTEPETATTRQTGEQFFRHTTVYEHAKEAVSFAQQVPYIGRPLWPCPGMGVMRTMDENES